MVVDAEEQSLQYDCLAEGALHDHYRRIGEVDFALRIAPDVTGEMEVGQPVGHGPIDHLAVQEEPQRLLVEAEVSQGTERPPHSGDHPITAALRQSSGEELEDASPVCGTGSECSPNHRQFVVVGQ